MPHSEWVRLENCRILAKTEWAALVRHVGKDVWLAFSVMPPGEGERLQVGGVVDVSVAARVAKQKGLSS